MTDRPVTTGRRIGLPVQRPGVVLKETGGKHALIGPDGSALCELNDTALALWELCDGATRPEEMIDAICAMHDVVRDMVVEDVERTLNELTNAGAVEWDDASVGGRSP